MNREDSDKTAPTCRLLFANSLRFCTRYTVIHEFARVTDYLAVSLKFRLAITNVPRKSLIVRASAETVQSQLSDFSESIDY